MTTKRSLPKTPSESTELTSLPKIEPPSPLKFPTFAELVELEQNQPPTTGRRKMNDLFDGVLGDVTLLLADFQDHPEKYGKETHGLLEQLMSGSTSIEQLSASERRLLNLATFDYYQAVPRKQPDHPARAAATPQLTRRQRRIKQKAERPRPRPGIDVPVTELPAYWWMS